MSEKGYAINRDFLKFRVFMVCILLFNFAYFVCNYFKRGSFFNLTPAYYKLYLLFLICWMVASIIGKKFKPASYTTYFGGILTILRSSLYLTYCITFIVVMTGLIEYSRMQIFATCILTCLLEAGAWSVCYGLNNGRPGGFFDIASDLKKNISPRYYSNFLVFADIILIAIVFFLVNYIKRDSFQLLPQYEKLLLLIYGVWFFSALSTTKFVTKKHRNFYFSLWQWLKAGGLMLAVISVTIYGFRLFYFSRFQIFGSLLLLIFFELVILRIYFWVQAGDRHNHDIESIDAVKNIINREPFSLTVDIGKIRKKLFEPARKKIKEKLNTTFPDLFTFIDQTIDLSDMINLETSVENSNELFIQNSDRIPVRLFLNLHKINDIRRINKYFLQVHQMLLPGGYYIAWVHTIKTHKEWIYSKYPRQIANVVYFFDFCFNRMMPKLPGLKKIYFAITRGNGRIVSRAEILGRLCFCGFEIAAERSINMRLCIIARKVKEPSLDQNPTYGPFISLNRVGYNQKLIRMYKFRTMHPYSEYLQKYVYEMNGLKKGGKLNKDFRTTTWGRFMRKCWLDELPMVYNWVKGDLQLVGVRPISLHYLQLYDENLQELRTRVRPGLLPPFYADLPKTFKEICDSERKYINAFLKNPVRTQIRYFLKIAFNIVLKGVRSN